MNIKVSDYIFKFVAETGIKHVFLLPGGGCMHLLDSLGRQEQLHPICCLHEQAATIAAEAYGQYTNQLGVALVTTGPGGTNAITGVTGAWIDSTPMLILSGQVKRQDRLTDLGVRQMGIQEVDIIRLVSPITKYAVTVMAPEKIKYHLQKALFLATTGRKGPVWLDIPLDVQGSVVEEDALEDFEVPTAEGPNMEALNLKAQLALALLDKAERPVILVGNGVRLANAQSDFLRLIERLNVPILVTWKASDLAEKDTSLYIGKPGAIGQRAANFAQQNADWILCLGARLDLCQVGHDYPNFARMARKIIVDIDQAEIDKLEVFGMKIDVKVNADAGSFLTVLLESTQAWQGRDFSTWLGRCLEWKRRYPPIRPEDKLGEGRVNLYHLVDVLSDLLETEDLIVPGSSGACAEVVQQAFRIKTGQRLLNTPGLGAMGFGLPAAIGACLASSRRRTVSIIGDGGLQHNIQELETLARLKLPIKYFILNNGGYGSIKAMQDNHFSGRHVCCDENSGLTLPDITKVASAYGLSTARIENQRDLPGQVRQVLQMEGTVVCDVLLDPKVQTAPRLSSRVLADGRIVSSPLEDLWPFLDRDEFTSNMLLDGN